jgi:hypothetical protein
MFIDDMKNRYVYLNSMKNVVWEEPLERSIRPNISISISPDIEPVLDKLMRERPTWRYKCVTYFYGSDGPHYSSRFAIFDGDEQLGEVWSENHWRNKELRFYFNNFRLNKERQRNTMSYTSKPELAVKRIVKAFHMKTASERAVDTLEEVKKVSGALHGDASWPVRKAKSAIEDELYLYAVKNWDAVRPMLSAEAQKIDLPSLLTAANDAYLMRHATDNGLGTNVRLEPNGTYSLSRWIGNVFETSTCVDDSLPEHIRSALGLLKMMNDKSAIPEVGLRVNSTTYFVMDKKDK